MNNFEEIKNCFYSYDKKKQEFIIYQIYIAAGLYFDFTSKYNKLKKKNLYINTPLLYSIIYGYFYLYFAYIVLYIIFNKNSLSNKLRKIKNFSNKFRKN